MGRNIEGFEIMVVVFDFRSFHHLVTHAGEKGFNPTQDSRHRMHCATRNCATRQGHINGAGFGSTRGFRCAKRLFLPIKRVTNGFFQLIDGRAGRRALVCREFAQPFQEFGHSPLLTQKLDA